MPVCPKCRMTFTYTADHVCEGHDYTKVWSGTSVPVGALVGGPLGYLYGLSIIRQACDEPARAICAAWAALFLPFQFLSSVGL